jgi:hypothetical protein
MGFLAYGVFNVMVRLLFVDNCNTKTALQNISLAHLTHLTTSICSQRPVQIRISTIFSQQLETVYKQRLQIRVQIWKTLTCFRINLALKLLQLQHARC